MTVKNAYELVARDACQLGILCRNMTDKRFFFGVFASSRFIHAICGACVARMNQSLVEQAQHSRDDITRARGLNSPRWDHSSSLVDLVVMVLLNLIGAKVS